mmetsp:Transcript_15050/g.24778  ORF Transcript_15050/g.24778 Transcript_15050/m.24778 type:complete len:230 (-) Transcript_15050:432-1121(-)
MIPVFHKEFPPTLEVDTGRPHVTMVVSSVEIGNTVDEGYHLEVLIVTVVHLLLIIVNLVVKHISARRHSEIANRISCKCLDPGLELKIWMVPTLTTWHINPPTLLILISSMGEAIQYKRRHVTKVHTFLLSLKDLVLKEVQHKVRKVVESYMTNVGEMTGNIGRQGRKNKRLGTVGDAERRDICVDKSIGVLIEHFAYIVLRHEVAKDEPTGETIDLIVPSFVVLWKDL